MLKRKHDTAVLITPVAKTVPCFKDCDYIGVDMGYEHIMEAGMTPLFAIGDFDSPGAEPDLAGRFTVLRHPIAKNETDTELALLQAASMGYARIIVWGALGGRLDHELANLRCLLWKVPQAVFLDETQRIRVFLPGEYVMNAQYPHISFFAAESSVITLDGFDYPLVQQHIDEKDFYTCSNSIPKGKEARVILEKGRVLCVETRRR